MWTHPCQFACVVSQSSSLKQGFVLSEAHIGMRGGRGAWMRFPDVCVKPVSFNERIAGSQTENEIGAVADRPTHPSVGHLFHLIADWPSHSHKSTCYHVCRWGSVRSVQARQLLIAEITTSDQWWHCRSPVHRSPQTGSAPVAPPLALNMLTCSSLDQQSDSVAHPIMRDKRSAEGEKLNPLLTVHRQTLTHYSQSLRRTL